MRLLSRKHQRFHSTRLSSRSTVILGFSPVVVVVVVVALMLLFAWTAIQFSQSAQRPSVAACERESVEHGFGADARASLLLDFLVVL